MSASENYFKQGTVDISENWVVARFVWQRAAAAKDTFVGGKSYCVNADQYEFLSHAASILVSDHGECR